jgi:hypothetical protein
MTNDQLIDSINRAIGKIDEAKESINRARSGGLMGDGELARVVDDLDASDCRLNDCLDKLWENKEKP